MSMTLKLPKKMGEINGVLWVMCATKGDRVVNILHTIIYDMHINSMNM